MKIILLFFVLFSCSSDFSSSLSSDRKPNIIFILVDDMGYGDLSSYGQKSFSTTNIDRLAEEGIKFVQHYSGSTVCLPSRVSLMTGKDTANAPIITNGPYRLAKDPLDMTIASYLKEAGYQTGMIGKSCVTGNLKDGTAPRENGFDYFYGTLSHTTAHHHWPKVVWENNRQVVLKGNKGKEGNFYAPDKYTEKSLDFINRNRDKPFFLLLSYPIPHADVDVPENYLKKFIGKFGKDFSYKGGSYKATNYVKAGYGAMVQRIDLYVGEIMALLKELNLDKDTLVCFTSDNGPHKEGGYRVEYFNSNGGLRGVKRDLYEGGIRVPFIVRYPLKIKEGQVTDHVSAFWDILPTFCELVGVDLMSDTQGISFLPTLFGSPETQKKHKFLYWEFVSRKKKTVALRKDEWKIVLSDGGEWELYNLSTDEKEQNNLAFQYPKVLESMISIARQHRLQNKKIKIWF